MEKGKGWMEKGTSFAEDCKGKFFLGTSSQ
jgi:hypothetical protein